MISDFEQRLYDFVFPLRRQETGTYENFVLHDDQRLISMENWSRWHGMEAGKAVRRRCLGGVVEVRMQKPGGSPRANIAFFAWLALNNHFRLYNRCFDRITGRFALANCRTVASALMTTAAVLVGSAAREDYGSQAQKGAEEHAEIRFLSRQNSAHLGRAFISRRNSFRNRHKLPSARKRKGIEIFGVVGVTKLHSAPACLTRGDVADTIVS